jgi:uncharacterized protein YabE (DUF348 family)
MHSTTTKKAKKHRSAFVERVRRLGIHSHPFVIPVTTFLLLFFFTLAVFVNLNGHTVGASDSRVVHLSINGQQQVVPTRAATVGDLLQRLDIQLNEKDVVEPAAETLITEDDFHVNVYRARPVTIVDQGRKITTMSAAPTPRQVAENAGVKVYPEDKVEKQTPTMDASDVMRDGLVAEKVVIDRATPVNINLYGNVIDARTQAKTVGEALKEKDIKLREGDTLQPSADTAVTSNTQIFIVRVGHQVASSEEEIPAPVETVQDPNLAAGSSTVKEPGAPGKKLVTYEVELRNGQEVSRKVLQEVIVAQPARRLVAKGTKSVFAAVTGDKASLMLAAGIPESQHYAADYVISHESHWNLSARNSGGCLGLGQACPGSKLVAACPSYASDAVCQLQYFTGYANGRYGSWAGAYNFWLVNHWW